MTCDAYQELIPEYLEKSLPSELEQELTRHMDTCAACQKYLQAAKALSAAIQTLPRHQSSTETRLKIIAAIQQTAPARRSGEFGPVLDMDDLAQYLRVDKTVLGTYLDDIPHFELGGKLLFRRKSVDQWIEAREQSATYQLNPSFPSNVMVFNL